MGCLAYNPGSSPSFQGSQGRNLSNWTHDIRSQEQREKKAPSPFCLLLAQPAFFTFCSGSSLGNGITPSESPQICPQASLTYAVPHVGSLPS